MRAIESPIVRSNRLGSKTAACLQALRPKQWTKNLVVFIPIIFSAKADQVDMALNAVLCMVSFCLLSGAIYLFNDIVDIDRDRLHPRKCSRPIASGKISINLAWAVCFACATFALFVASFVRGSLVLIMVSYLGLSALYSLVLKHVAILDILAIATGFLLRVGAGAISIWVPVSGWLLLSIGLGALFLALEKRRRELLVVGSTTVGARCTLNTYSQPLLNRLEALVLPSILVSYCLYGFLSIHGQWMMLSVPFVLYGVMRYLQLSYSDSVSTEEPDEILLHDRPIQITIFLWLFTCILVVYGVIQHITCLLVRTVDYYCH